MDPAKLAAGEAEMKLFQLLTKIKIVSVKRKLLWTLKRPKSQKSIGDDRQDMEIAEHHCFAKGMGLILAVKGRRTRFSIFFKTVTKLDLVVEVIGPNNSIGVKRVVNSIKSLLTNQDRTGLSPTDTSDGPKIPIMCEVSSQRVKVTYVPVVTGSHRLNIIWEGHHIDGSPFTVKVDDSFEACDEIGSCSNYPLFAYDMKLPLKSTIIRKRILKQVFVVNGQEQPVNKRINLFDDVDSDCDANSAQSPQDAPVTKTHINPRLAEIVADTRAEKHSSKCQKDDCECDQLYEDDKQPDQQPATESTNDAANCSNSSNSLNTESKFSSPEKLDLEHSSSPSSQEWEVVTNVALIETPKVDLKQASSNEVSPTFSTLSNKVNYDQHIEQEFQKIANQAVEELEEIPDIGAVLSQDSSPFKNYLPRKKSPKSSKSSKSNKTLNEQANAKQLFFKLQKLEQFNAIKVKNVNNGEKDKFFEKFKRTRTFWLDREKHAGNWICSV